MKFLSARILAASAWLALSLSLGLWWTIMGLRQAVDLATLQNQIQDENKHKVFENLKKKHRMIKMEGGFFLVLITGGGFMLILMSLRDERRNQMIKDFFATVSHEMKTPLASLRLQAESLSEIIRNKAQKVLLERLVSDTQRLELQMEKALYLASISRAESLYITEVTLRDLLFSILSNYDNISFTGDLNQIIFCDKKATESMIKNLVENSYHHGEATQVSINLVSEKNYLHLVITDNGKGFKGNKDRVGELFFKHTESSGSGIGLYLVKTLMKKMNGIVEILFLEQGFGVKLGFPRKIN